MRGGDQGVGAGGLQLLPRAVAPEHAEAAHAVGSGAGDVVAAVADHHAGGRIEVVAGEDMGDQLGLVIQRAAGLGAVNRGEPWGQARVVEDPLGEDPAF